MNRSLLIPLQPKSDDLMSSSPVEAILTTISIIMSKLVLLNENTTKAFPPH